MNIALWVVQVLLAVVFFGAGSMKLAKSKEALSANENMAWASAFPPAAIKLIGVAEVLGAIGLVLPAAVNVLPVLVAVAAVGIVLLMIGAAITHVRRGEYSSVALNVVLLGFAGFVMWGRLGPYGS